MTQSLVLWHQLHKIDVQNIVVKEESSEYHTDETIIRTFFKSPNGT